MVIPAYKMLALRPFHTLGTWPHTRWHQDSATCSVQIREADSDVKTFAVRHELGGYQEEMATCKKYRQVAR